MENKYYVLLFVLILSSQFLLAQENDKFITAIVKIQNIESTGKRANSYFFTFKITEALEGSIKDSIIKSQEIYNRFGGSQILAKIHPEKRQFLQKLNDKNNELIIRFAYSLQSSGNKSNSILFWVAEKHRRKSLERLEVFLNKYFLKKKRKADRNLLLKEYGGKLFFKDGKKAKVVVETLGGDWFLATIDKTEFD